MRMFDTKVQHFKYKIIREVARLEWEGTLMENIWDIPEMLIPGKTPTMRCCVYKERAIISERVRMAMGGHKDNPNVIEVLSIACDECPMGGYEVTNACRGCLAHRCEDVCRFGAISFDENHEAHIDKSKCRECGQCSKVCPYTAIVHRMRPCENACKVKAISVGEDMAASIDNDKCIACGSCVFMCPFGAIMEKSFVLDAIDLIKKSNNNENYNMYAVVAPAIASQFSYAKLGQVISGIKELGFKYVYEAALGADIVAKDETAELLEKGFLTTSCCPAFVSYVEKEFPDMLEFVSHNPSPMAAMGKYIKEKDPTAKVVFIGPCTAKKKEISKESVAPYVDVVLTFQELQALFDSKDLDIVGMEEEQLDDASYFGRMFARSGGVAAAVAEGIRELGADFDLNSIACDGIEQCKIALLQKRKGVLPNNFIEGMACVGGCVGGAGCMTHSDKNKVEVEKFSKLAEGKTILGVVDSLK